MPIESPQNSVEPSVVRVTPTDTDLLRKILEIHDQMPVEWDSGHTPNASYVDDAIQRIQTSAEPDAFWVLSQGAVCNPASIVGTFWARIKKDGRDGAVTCSVNSIWIHPNFRHQQWISKFAQPCLEWAKEKAAVRIICGTHTHNKRMQDILEKNGFLAEMIHYTRPLSYAPKVQARPQSLGRRKVLENQVFDLFFEEVMQDHQKLIPNYLVVAPKHRVGDVTGVIVVPYYRQAGSLWIGLLQIYRVPVRAKAWEAPKGFIEPSESFVSSAQRELHEEIGVDLPQDRFAKLGEVMPEPGLADARVLLYSARLDGPLEHSFVPNETGHLEFQFFSAEEIQKMIFHEIQDSTTISAIFGLFREEGKNV